VTDASDRHRSSRPVAGPLLVVVAAVIWGTTGTATHLAPGVPAFVFGAVTFGLGGLVMAGATLGPTRRALADRRIRGRVLLAAAALAVYAVVFYLALAEAGVAVGTTVAIGSSPAFAGVLEWASDRRRVTGRWVTATVISVAGMALLTLARGGGSGSAPATALIVGVLAALAAGFTYAMYTWLVAGALGTPTDLLAAERPEARGVAGAVFVLAALPLVVLAVAFGWPDLVVPKHWPVFLYLALVPTAIGHTLYAVGLRTVSSSLATLLSLLEPVVAAVLAVLVVGESIGVLGWIGVVLVVVGLAVLALPASAARGLSGSRRWPTDRG
jgi:drug/metabolite transporter, DME family